MQLKITRYIARSRLSSQKPWYLFLMLPQSTILYSTSSQLATHVHLLPIHWTSFVTSLPLGCSLRPNCCYINEDSLICGLLEPPIYTLRKYKNVVNWRVCARTHSTYIITFSGYIITFSWLYYNVFLVIL